MKKSFLAFLLVAFSLSAFAQHTKKDLVGKWEGTDSQNVKASIQFLDTNKVLVFIQGHNFPPYTYTADLPKSPAKIDITMLTPDGGSATLPGFLMFVDDNTIRWQIFPGGNRPAAFDENADGGSIITLKRLK
ncbi:MAG TPA: hypothetical protein VG367_18880 [Mucilaginibacter sp.]|jgi:hypothetical protein|nr:hypothetical protein [Mucilaginibacter sp.]